jgi:CheY-like chemotaxis protein
LKKILIVDDETDVTYTLQKMIEKDGYDVQAYNDPHLALKSFKQDLFDLVLLDIRMPHMDGFKLFEQIRKIDAKVKACFMTAFEVYRDQFGQLPSSDIQHFIKKPVELIELREIIQGL